MDFTVGQNLNIFKMSFGDQLITIALAASRAERHRRIVNRKDGHRQYTIEQARERDVNEIENLEKGGPIAYADFTLVNLQNKEELIAQLDSLLAAVLPTYVMK